MSRIHPRPPRPRLITPGLATPRTCTINVPRLNSLVTTLALHSYKSSSSETPKTWYTGSCHCGAVRYSVALDLSNPSFEATKCNCSICLKTNRLGVRIPDPEQSFKLLSPASLDDVPAYRFATKQSQHRFCNKCGIHLLCHGEYEYEGQVHKVFSINAVTLDPDQEGLDLREWKVRFWDGKKENWNAGPAEKPYPGGSYY